MIRHAANERGSGMEGKERGREGRNAIESSSTAARCKQWLRDSFWGRARWLKWKREVKKPARLRYYY